MQICGAELTPDDLTRLEHQLPSGPTHLCRALALSKDVSDDGEIRREAVERESRSEAA